MENPCAEIIKQRETNFVFAQFMFFAGYAIASRPNGYDMLNYSYKDLLRVTNVR